MYFDDMPSSAVSHLGLHCLCRPVCPNTYGKYAIPLESKFGSLTGRACLCILILVYSCLQMYAKLPTFIQN